jgi:hypothetical protein
MSLCVFVGLVHVEALRRDPKLIALRQVELRVLTAAERLGDRNNLVHDRLEAL